MTRIATVLVLTVQFLLGAKPPEIKDSLGLSVSSSPRISPDGSQVLWQASRTNWHDNSFEADIWIARTSPPFEPRRLTTAGWNGDAQWSADGKRFTFISDRGGHRQIYFASAAATDIRKLTNFDAGVSDYRLAPDGQSVAFTADDDDERPADFEVVNSAHNSRHLWKMTFEPGVKPSEIAADKDYSVGGFSWSPNSSKIAFQADGIYSLDVADGKITKLTGGSGPYRNPMWSPAGDYVAFETADGDPGFYYSNWRIARVPVTGGQAEILTGSFDENADLVSWTRPGSTSALCSAPSRTSSFLIQHRKQSRP